MVTVSSQDIIYSNSKALVPCPNRIPAFSVVCAGFSLPNLAKFQYLWANWVIPLEHRSDLSWTNGNKRYWCSLGAPIDSEIGCMSFLLQEPCSHCQ